MIGKDGQVVWLSDIVSVHITPDGRVHLCGVMLDSTERRRVEDALDDSENRFRAMFEHSGSGMALVDIDGHPVECNPALLKMLGYTAQELRAMPFPEFTHPDDRANDWELYRELQAGKRERYEIDKRYITKDGRTIWVNLVVTSLTNDRGLAKYVLGMVQDITERKHAQEELLTVSERLRLATRAANIGIWDWDVVHDRLVWDEASYRIFGVDKERFGGAYEAWAGSVAPADLQEAQRQVQASLRGEREVNIEYRIVCPDGSIHFVQSIGQTFRDSDGRPYRMVGVNYDITERKLAEERFATAFHAIPEPSVILRASDRTFLEVNERWQSIFGYTADEAIGRTSANLHGVPEEDRAHYGLLLEKGSLRDVPVDLKTKQGEVRHMTVSTERIVVNGEVCYILLGRDITDHKEAAKELDSSREQLRALSDRFRKAKEEEAVRIARELHDEMGGALTSLKWGLTKLRESDLRRSTNSADVETCRRIDEMVGTVDTTINAVRRIASELRPGVLDDLGLVAAIEWHARQFETETSIRCRFESQVENVEIRRDRATAVFRIYQETMTNVLRHSHATRVNILIEQDQGTLVLEVSDNGRGITDSEKLNPSSLGILGMRERAHSAGGTIDVRCRDSKGGTTVVVRLPLSEQ